MRGKTVKIIETVNVYCEAERQLLNIPLVKFMLQGGNFPTVISTLRHVWYRPFLPYTYV